MTKRELILEYEKLCNEKMNGARLDGINCNSNKREIENAINCLNASDEDMQDYLTVIKLAYPNTYKTIANNGDWLKHRFNRLYVWNTARMIVRGWK